MQKGEEILIERSVSPGELEWPLEVELAEEDYFNRGYRDLRGLSWDEAIRVLKFEREMITRNGADLRNAEGSMSDSESESLGDLDLGVAAAVVALSAAKCAPISSCNGSPGHHEAYPLVAFYCRKGRVRDILKAAELTDCGLHNGSAGDLVVYAGNVERLLNFAEALIEQRNELVPLARPQRASRSPKSLEGQRQLTLGL